MDELLELLRRGAARERAHARWYRTLSTRAEVAGDAAAAERLNELLADEQHHVSRLTARLLELGGAPGERGGAAAPEVELEGWEEEARRREEEEVAWYEDALEEVDDEPTRAVLAEILESERHHLAEVGGKWMAASPPSAAGNDEDEDEETS